jgi:hypothetical protein
VPRVALLAAAQLANLTVDQRETIWALETANR